MGLIEKAKAKRNGKREGGEGGKVEVYRNVAVCTLKKKGLRVCALVDEITERRLYK